MKKIVVIGAGPAGLSFAHEMLSKSKKYEVVILEESSSIGGISKTVNYKGNRMDIGGHRFFSKEKRVNDFWNKVMPTQGKPSYDDKKLKREKSLSKNGPDPEKTDDVMLVRNRISRIYYLKKFFDYPISLKLQTFTNMGLIRTIKSGFSYLKSMFIKKEETSLENFYINRFGKQLYSMFFEKYTEKLWGRHPSEISADWGSQRVKGLSILAVIKDFLHIGKKETSLIEEYLYPKYGPGQLWEKIASEIEKMGGKIKFEHKVKKINVKNKKIVSVECENGELIKGDIFISSMPLKDLVLGINDKNKKINNIAKDLPYRDFVTIGLLVDKLNLKNTTKIKTLNNIVPDCWIYVQEPDVKLGRIQIFNNWSPYMVKDCENTVWIGLEYFCNEFDDFWNLSDEEAISFATKELVDMGIIDKNAVIDSHREKVKKAYPAYFDSYKDIDKLINYVNSYDNLYCIGRNGQHRYNNMDHSMMTGFICCDNILNGIKDKSNIWSVNTEDEYHESIKETSDDKNDSKKNTKIESHNKTDSRKETRKNKNKFSLIYLGLVFAIAEILFYIVQPFIKNYESHIIISLIVIFAIIGIVKYFKRENSPNKDFIIYIILSIGFLVRLYYICKTPFYIRQHDVGTLDSYEHLSYIYTIFKTGKLPSTNIGQYYHPPLSHIFSALWLKVNDIFKVDFERTLEGLQYLPLFYSSLSMIVIYKIIDKLNVKDTTKILSTLLISFFPTFIILSGSINNDCLLVLFQLCIIYYLIVWYDNSSLFNTIVLALMTGLCVMTKLNGAIVAVPIIFVFIKKIINSYKENKKDLKKIITYIIIFGLISLPIGLWFQIRNYYLFSENKVPVPPDWLYTGDYNFLERFILIDFKNLIKVFVTLPGEYSIPNYIVKSSIFGEYTFDNLSIIHYALLFLNLALIIISTFFIIKYIFKDKKDNLLTNILIINWITNLISFYIFNINYPYLCTMDYRYIVTTFLTGALLLTINCDNEKISSKIISGTILAYVTLCIIFILNIT